MRCPFIEVHLFRRTGRRVEFLCLRRARTRRLPGIWQPVTGKRRRGETAFAAARREVREETGLELDRLTLFGVFSGADLFYRYPNGDEVHNVTIVYLARPAGTQVRLNAEHTQWGWFAPREVPEDLSPPIRPVIERFLRP